MMMLRRLSATSRLSKAANNMIFFLPMIFIINADIMEPTIELRVSKDTIQEASFKFKRRIAPSPFIKKGKDSDAQPKNKPTADSIPRFLIKIMDFEED